MNISDFRLNQFNITLLYETLDLGLISRDKVVKAFEERPIITEFPEVLIAVDQSQKRNAQFGNRRIHINLQVENEDVDNKVKWITNTIIQIASAVEDSKLIAYGFNIDGESTLEIINVGEYFKDKFLLEQKAIENTLKGSIVSTSPNFTVKQPDCDFNVALIPGVNNLGFHVNCHFESNALPIDTEMYRQFQGKLSVIKELLSEM
ncbi:hypothetical protein [Desulfosporosinus fructosivorans]